MIQLKCIHHPIHHYYCWICYQLLDKMYNIYYLIDQLSQTNKVRNQIIINNRYGSLYEELGIDDKAILYYNKALNLSLNQESVDKEDEVPKFIQKKIKSA